MLVSDFKKIICNIDNHLYAEVGDGSPAFIKVRYSLINDDPLTVLMIGLSGDLSTCNNGFELLSNKSKRKLLIAGIDMAMTPLHKRVEHKWNVIIADDSADVCPLSVWKFWKNNDASNHDYIIVNCDRENLKDRDYYFTDSEYRKLIKFIKTLPDGDWQAKVAEHGKREVED